MKSFLNRYIIHFIAVISLLCASNVKWGGNRWKEIVAFDGKGYYAYLPAIFIYDDLHFIFHDSIEKKYASKNTYYEYRVIKENGVVDKYYAGTAFMQLPFFIAAHLITKISGGITDGYSFIYQLAISIAGIFYGLIGLSLLRRLFRIYAIPENIISIVLVAIFFGTHLFYYCVLEPSLSHVYSFAAITAFILTLKKYIQLPDRKLLILSGLILGIIVLIRPVNGLIIFILPFLAGDKENFLKIIKAMFKKNSGVLLSILLFLFIISIQGIIYFVQTGQFYVYSYTVERFIWHRPEILNILFSYRKGLFVYTPLTLIALISFIIFYRKNIFLLFSFLLFLLTITYVFSCWWLWSYGGSFSSRPYVEFLPLFGLILALSLMKIKDKLLRMTTYALFISCIILCQVQTLQFRYFIIHWDKMDKEHYWRVFMRADLIYKKENPNKDLLE